TMSNSKSPKVWASMLSMEARTCDSPLNTGMSTVTRGFDMPPPGALAGWRGAIRRAAAATRVRACVASSFPRDRARDGAIDAQLTFDQIEILGDEVEHGAALVDAVLRVEPGAIAAIVVEHQ